MSQVKSVQIVDNGRMIHIHPDQLFTITGGPGKWDLLVSLGEAYVSRKKVEFKYFMLNSRFNVHLPVVITELSHEDGSGESWNFAGTAEFTNGSKRIKGYYSSLRRTGTFKIVP